MSYPLLQLVGGSQAFNHSRSDAAEAEYDRLRSLARQEQAQRSRCFDQARLAYDRGDGAAAHELSEQAKRHGQLMEQYNRQASEFIFRENNAPGRVAPDAIDLHGLYVEEAEDILRQRIQAARAQGQTHLHVIVGKGNHSANHVQKLKPRVEQLCGELGLQYGSEENAGRIYVDLTAGGSGGGADHHHGQPHPHPHQPQGYPHGQHHGHPHGQQHHEQQHGGAVEQAIERLLPRILRKLEACCIVM